MAGWKKGVIAGPLLVLICFTGLFLYYYVRFSRLIDARLSGEIFNNASLVFSAPTPISVGESGSPEAVAQHLRRALYAEGSGGSDVGSYTLAKDTIEIIPGSLSYFADPATQEGPARLTFRDRRLASIAPAGGGDNLETYELEPEVITTLFDNNRSKRRLVRFPDLPKVLIDAIVAAEDHRFFSHHGVDILRIPGAALADIRANCMVKVLPPCTLRSASSCRPPASGAEKSRKHSWHCCWKSA